MKQTFSTIFVLLCSLLAFSKSKIIKVETDVGNDSEGIKSKKVEESGQCGYGWLDAPYYLGKLFSKEWLYKCTYFKKTFMI